MQSFQTQYFSSHLSDLHLSPGSCVLPYRGSVGVQVEPPQDMPQWYADCFELKATLAAGLRETSAPPLKYLEEFELGVLLIRDYQR